MAPRLAQSQIELVEAMVPDIALNDKQRAEAADCSTRAVRRVRANMRCFGSARAPPNGGGRPRSITPSMLNALCDRLIEKPCMYQDEMVVFLWDEFEILVTTYSISRALASIRWSNKTARRVAKERNADLRDLYLHKLSAFRSYQLVYIDESGCDKRIGFRRTGWSPLGVTPVQIAKFHRGRRYQILPAHEGVVLDRPAQIYFAGDRLSYWVWVPTLNRAEEKAFNAQVKAFIDRANRLDMDYFPGIESTGEGTHAPSPRGSTSPDYPKRRTGLSGTIYEKVGEVISRGGFREVFCVQIISPEPGDRQDQPKSEQPMQELVAKEIFHKGNSPSTKQWFREMQENECKIVMNNPNPHINAIIDIAYVPGSDDTPWIIEEYQPYCLDDEKLPFDVDAEDMVWQLVSGLKHYHDSGIMHHDIKPSNILMRRINDPKNGNPRWLFKFTDHGMARRTNHPVQGLAGTGWYCAPEILDREPHNEKADIFSLGVEFLGSHGGLLAPRQYAPS
ncbi:hypothetical protein PGQ11_002842 [Apiospora arundinis]|uniref:Protein kinase domain-containing protein n=1 Tax=Apiospora arundinis TaxID=335852 RepID=A0ABR2J392_9PEZI